MRSAFEHTHTHTEGGEKGTRLGEGAANNVRSSDPVLNAWPSRAAVSLFSHSVFLLVPAPLTVEASRSGPFPKRCRHLTGVRA